MKVVIAGGTAFVAKYVAEKFKKDGFEVSIISRQQNHINWTNKKAIATALEGAYLLINLAGKSVDCRYNQKNKNEILESRVNTTAILGNAILQCHQPPMLWINASTATIYRHAEDRPMTETNGEIGTGFSVNVATKWEQAFFSYHLKNTRQVALRLAIILGKDGGVVKPYANLVKYGLGGVQGNGLQMFSWIHIEDVYRIFLFLATHENLTGVFNAAAPNPVSNYTLMATLRKLLHIPFGLPSPKWMLKIGAALIKTETELVLKSRWVLPERLLHENFEFTFNTIDKALQDVL